MEAFDVVVIGGGPAGATFSTLVPRAGHRVLLSSSDPLYWSYVSGQAAVQQIP